MQADEQRKQLGRRISSQRGGHAPQFQHADQVGELAMQFLRVRPDAK